jgi:hypothetical protein
MCGLMPFYSCRFPSKLIENTAITVVYEEKPCLEAGDGVGGDGGVGASHVRRGVDVVKRRGEHVGLRCGGRVAGRGGGGEAAAGDAVAESRGERPRRRPSKGEATGTTGEGGAWGAEEGPPGGHGRHRRRRGRMWKGFWFVRS